ncbi:MAG: hypothetical protein HOQ29_18360 [Acidobacteria bacterium]|nr:hypothetical protein [Acidobacteriota bacterium]
MPDQERPTRSSNMEKAEGDRDTVSGGETPRRSEWGEGTSEGGGITNRPLAEETDQQKDVPERGDRKGGAHAG